MTFLDIALQHAALGLYVFPVARDKSTLTQHGFKDASVDPEVIRAWWAQMPSANPGFAPGASDVAVLDVDHGLSDMASFIAWRDRNNVPATYTVRSGSRPELKIHMYFRGAIRDIGIWELDGCSGQVKSLGGYVLAAGSEALHGEKHDKPGAPYEVIDGVLGVFAPTPDVIRQLKKPATAPTSNSKVPKTAWSVPVHAGENRTGFLLEQTGAMRNLGCGKDAIYARMMELNSDPEIIADPVDHDRLESTAANCAKFPVPEQAPIVVLGCAEEKPPEAAPLPERNRPTYPVEVWDGTAVGEFAKLCAHDNNIPRKLYAEAFRCALGAVVGDRLSCPGVDGALPRSYTIIVAPKGKGKGTAIRRAVEFFRQTWTSLPGNHGVGTSVTPGLLSGERDFAWKPKGIGAHIASASSVPGMARLTKDLDSTIKNKPHMTWGNTLPRILSVHEEMKTFLSTLFIEGGVGSGMEGVVCQLWDDVSFHGTATGTRDAVYGEMLFSLLAGVTETDWFDLLGRGDAVGGGLMSRLNIIGTEGEYENVARMNPPDVTQLQETFLSRVLRLEDSHVKLATTKDADAVISQWADNLPEGSERMNVHAWRSALLLAWLRHEEIITAKTAEDAVRLGQYQVDSHEFYRVKAADTSNARVQAKILRALEMRGPMSRRKLQQHTNAHRDGTDLWSRALEGLLRDRSVGKQED
ncbi:MAG: bifunctional DNA primase/polymerase, partial [Candidatus Sulfotelmatobacter sp.]